jgi:hypothetical protein
MNLAGRIHFHRACLLPSPWVLSVENGFSNINTLESFTLRRIACAPNPTLKRAAVRTALKEELHWEGGRPIRWRESEKGPEVLEPLERGPVSVSISYAPREAWLALGWEGHIGVDAVATEAVADWEEVASLYLEPTAQERLRKSVRPELDFAREWAGFEARLKLGGLSLHEGVSPPPALLFEASFATVSVAVALNLRSKSP